MANRGERCGRDCLVFCCALASYHGDTNGQQDEPEDEPGQDCGTSVGQA